MEILEKKKEIVEIGDVLYYINGKLDFNDVNNYKGTPIAVCVKLKGKNDPGNVWMSLNSIYLNKEHLNFYNEEFINIYNSLETENLNYKLISEAYANVNYENTTYWQLIKNYSTQGTSIGDWFAFPDITTETLLKILPIFETLNSTVLSSSIVFLTGRDGYYAGQPFGFGFWTVFGDSIEIERASGTGFFNDSTLSSRSKLIKPCIYF